MLWNTHLHGSAGRKLSYVDDGEGPLPPTDVSLERQVSPKGPQCQYKIKFDGYRALGLKGAGKLAFFLWQREAFLAQKR